MRTLYLDCQMGAAGDMLWAALLELIPDQDEFIEKMNRLSIPGVSIQKETTEKCGIRGTHISVKVNGMEEESHDVSHHGDDHDHHHEHDHHHHEHGHTHSHSHSSMADMEHLIKDHMDLPAKVKKDVLAVYGLIAQAESHAHGAPVSDIHFHEVGTMDAVADITAVCLLMNEIKPDQVIASAVHVGSGSVQCAHGILPVPAPATAYILRDVPIYGGSIEGELCTPTGAALLKYFVDRFDAMPVMKTEKIGYGCGKKDFPAANCVRAMLGETAEKTADAVTELSCNLDDMTAEAIGFAMEQLLSEGALDVYTTSIGMKKMRPGTKLSVLCKEEDREKMAALIFRYTTTIGIRENRMDRFVLARQEGSVQTSYGSVRYKTSKGYGTERKKPEYEDLARIAAEKEIDLDSARNLINGMNL